MTILIDGQSFYTRLHALQQPLLSNFTHSAEALFSLVYFNKFGRLLILNTPFERPRVLPEFSVIQVNSSITTLFISWIQLLISLVVSLHLVYSSNSHLLSRRTVRHIRLPRNLSIRQQILLRRKRIWSSIRQIVTNISSGVLRTQTCQHL